MIKKYWKIVIGIITGIIGILFIVSKNNSKKATKAKKKIDTNNTTINKLDGKIEEVQKQKEVIKKKASVKKTNIETLKQQKLKPVPKRVVKNKKESVKSAAANIRKRIRK